MGMLVTGSIMSPRIFISTSIVTPENTDFRLRLLIEDFRLLINFQSEIFNHSILNIILLRSLYHHFAQQTVGKTSGSRHRNVAARRPEPHLPEP